MKKTKKILSLLVSSVMTFSAFSTLMFTAEAATTNDDLFGKITNCTQGGTQITVKAWTFDVDNTDKTQPKWKRTTKFSLGVSKAGVAGEVIAVTGQADYQGTPQNLPFRWMNGKAEGSPYTDGRYDYINAGFTPGDGESLNRYIGTGEDRTSTAGCTINLADSKFNGLTANGTAMAGTYTINLYTKKVNQPSDFVKLTSQQNVILSTVAYTADARAVGVPAKQYKWYGTAQNLTTAKPTIDGVACNYWALSTNPYVPAYNGGEGMVDDQLDKVLVAVWSPTVSFDAAGGSPAPDATTQYFGATYTNLPTVSRDGYTFAGWHDANGNLIENGTTVTIPGNHTLTAYWTPNTYTVNFDKNDAEATLIGDASKQVTYDAGYGALPTCTKPHHGFVGWFTDPTAGEMVTPETIVKITNAQTLYAHYSMGSYDVRPAQNLPKAQSLKSVAFGMIRYIWEVKLQNDPMIDKYGAFVLPDDFFTGDTMEDMMYPRKLSLDNTGDNKLYTDGSWDSFYIDLNGIEVGSHTRDFTAIPFIQTGENIDFLADQKITTNVEESLVVVDD